MPKPQPLPEEIAELIDRTIAWLIAKQYRRRARELVVIELEPDETLLRERPNLKIVEASLSVPRPDVALS
jgi:hypothetical protein